MHPVDVNRDPRVHSERRVGLFIDFNDLRRTLDDDAAEIEVREVANCLRKFAEEQGRVLLARAYGDWSPAPDEARAFRRQQIEPRMVLDKEDDDEHTEVVLSLDVFETVFTGPALETYILVSGINSYPEILQRLRRADRQVVQITTNGVDGFAGNRQVALGELLRGATPKRPKIDLDSYDWTIFVKLMDDLEEHMPFVGFGWLLKKKLGVDNCGCDSMQERQELMDLAVDQAVLVLHKVDNIEADADPVTACKLNRESSIVRGILT